MVPLSLMNTRGCAATATYVSCLQVFDAWLAFVLEQQRKKGRIERAVEIYRADLLREGVTRILRYTAGMKEFRGHLQAQHQVKVKEWDPSCGSLSFHIYTTLPILFRNRLITASYTVVSFLHVRWIGSTMMTNNYLLYYLPFTPGS